MVLTLEQKQLAARVSAQLVNMNGAIKGHVKNILDTNVALLTNGVKRNDITLTAEELKSQIDADILEQLTADIEAVQNFMKTIKD